MGAFPRFAQTDAGFGAGVTVGLDSQVAVGDIQYVMVASDSATAHVWPIGWTVLLNVAGGPGRVSVAKRTRVLGDGNPTVTGGTSGHFAASAFALKATGPNPASIAAEASKINASSAAVLTAALAAADAHPTSIYMIAITATNTITAQYPLLAPIIDGGAVATAPQVLFRPYGNANIPAFTLTQSAASPSVVYCIAAITTPDEIYTTKHRDALADYVRWEGYNKYPLKEASLGGGISIA